MAKPTTQRHGNRRRWLVRFDTGARATVVADTHDAAADRVRQISKAEPVSIVLIDEGNDHDEPR